MLHSLFPSLPAPVAHALDALPAALNAALPMKGAHKRDLPQAIAELSLRLTAERGGNPLPYWSSPRLTAAYVWYFLPWNLLRLTRLLQGLSLPEPTPLPVPPGVPAQSVLSLRSESTTAPRVWVDMGSGPLTLPLAMWLARPQWRTLPLTILCCDTAPQPMNVGRRIFTALAGEDSPWRIVTHRAPLDALQRECAHMHGVPWLVTAANVLNELQGRGSQPTWQRLEEFVSQTEHVLVRATAAAKPAGSAAVPHALLIEPGTRLGGKTLGAVRAFVQETGDDSRLSLLAPCRYDGPCPLADSRTWCHFTADVHGAPLWLRQLSDAAELPKESVSLTFIQMTIQGHSDADLYTSAKTTLINSNQLQTTQGNIARVISSPLRVPGVRGMARYACATSGLVLIEDAAEVPSGALVEIQSPRGGTGDADARRDAKSGAYIVRLTDSSQRAAREAAASGHILPRTEAEQMPRRSQPTVARDAATQSAAAPKASRNVRAHADHTTRDSRKGIDRSETDSRTGLHGRRDKRDNHSPHKGRKSRDTAGHGSRSRKDSGEHRSNGNTGKGKPTERKGRRG